jgi:hypothetical protein
MYNACEMINKYETFVGIPQQKRQFKKLMRGWDDDDNDDIDLREIRYDDDEITD